jgi:hypothetical protein
MSVAPFEFVGTELLSSIIPFLAASDGLHYLLRNPLWKSITSIAVKRSKGSFRPSSKFQVLNGDGTGNHRRTESWGKQLSQFPRHASDRVILRCARLRSGGRPVRPHRPHCVAESRKGKTKHINSRDVRHVSQRNIQECDKGRTLFNGALNKMPKESRITALGQNDLRCTRCHRFTSGNPSPNSEQPRWSGCAGQTCHSRLFLSGD